jgi:integrase/recombinase XerD
MRQAKVLNAAELKRLHAVVESKRHAVRNATAVALSFYAGLRACEGWSEKPATFDLIW